ncbi:menaquinone biosynthetic enzyme MqnA/MqnD family protein [Thermovibrio sp.]
MLKVGKIEYLNTIPVYYGFIKGKVPSKGIEFIDSVPSELNKMLREGLLDVSVISSYEYISNWDKYLLLPDFSISARRKVVSVLFLSTVPIHQLHRKDVWITRSSMTSRELLKYILREVYAVEPNFHYYMLKEEDLPPNPKALLAIGDDALKLLKSKKFSFVYDLAEEWFNMTGLPFVFALWAVRREVYEERKEEVVRFYGKLRESRKVGEGSYKEICKEASKRLNLPQGLCEKYLKVLNFHLGPEEISSIKLFSQKVGKEVRLQFIET